MNPHTPKRLTRWLLSHEQPAPLSLDHPAQQDLAWAADEIAKLRYMCARALAYGLNGADSYDAHEACAVGDEMRVHMDPANTKLPDAERSG